MASTHARRKALGDYGERVAGRYLEERGMLVLDRNWRCRGGEIDIVAADGPVLVVCEVKTRSSDRYGTGLQAITPAKAARLYRLGWSWAASHQARFSSLRVDVIAVSTGSRGRPSVDHVAGVV